MCDKYFKLEAHLNSFVEFLVFLMSPRRTFHISSGSSPFYIPYMGDYNSLALLKLGTAMSLVWSWNRSESSPCHFWKFYIQHRIIMFPSPCADNLGDMVRRKLHHPPFLHTSNKELLAHKYKKHEGETSVLGIWP